MFLKMQKRSLSFLLVLILMISVLAPTFAVPASAADSLGSGTFTWGDKTVTVSGTQTSAQYGGSMEVNDTEKKLTFSGTGGRQGNEINLTLTLPEFTVLQFDYSETVNGTLSKRTISYGPSNDQTTINPSDGAHYTIGVEDDTTVKISFKTGAGSTNNFEATLSNMTLSDAEGYAVTINGAAHGTVTVGTNDYTDGESVTKTVSSARGIDVKAAPDSGYTFAGYSVDGSNVYQGASSANDAKTSYLYTYIPNSDGTTITPVFVSKSVSNFLVGDETSGYHLTSDFAEACSYAASHNSENIIVLNDSTVAAGDYTIPSGTTVVIPNDIANTVYTNQPNVVTKASTPQAYAKLTLQNGANLSFSNGSAMSIAGNLYAPGAGKASSVTGAYGQLVVSDGAKVTFNSGSELYAWGFATGGGEIECCSGSQAHEMFQINDFAGGSISINLVQYQVDEGESKPFPFSQYYVQNVECKLRIDAGASEKVFGSVYAGSTTMTAELDFIGGDSAMFTVKDGSVVKYYDFDADKLVCRVEGDAEISPISVEFAGVTIDSSDFQLPISNIGVEVTSGSTVNVSQSLQILPDSYVTVDENATMTINSEVYLIDASDWENGNHVYNKVDCRPLVYSATRFDETGDGSSDRSTTGGNMTSATLDNNGDIILETGTLSTTPGGAVITSSEGTGTFENQNNYPALPLVLVDFSQSTEDINNIISSDEPETQFADLDNPEPEVPDVYHFDPNQGTEGGSWEPGPAAPANKHSLTLDGKIGVNFYVVLPDGYTAENTTMDFTWGNKYISTHTYSEEEPYSETGVTGTPDGDYTKFTVYIAAKELNDDITAVLKCGNETLSTETYSGADYAYDVLSRNTLDGYTEAELTKLKALCRSMLIYAAKSQLHLEYNTDALADDDLDDNTLEPIYSADLMKNQMTNLPTYLQYYGTALNLGSETSYDICLVNRSMTALDTSAEYYYGEEPINTSVTNNGVAYIVKIENLPAARITDMVSLTINGETVYVTTTSYIKDVLENTSDSDPLTQAVTALYRYGESAKAFFNN